VINVKNHSIGAGVTDFISLAGTNGKEQMEGYLNANFRDNLELYIERSPIFHIKNIKTPALLQGGLSDQNVPHTQLKEFYHALKKEGKTVKLIGYPNCTHDYYNPRLYLQFMKTNLEWIKKYFDE